MRGLGYVLLIGVLLFLLWYFVLRKFKLPKLTAITMFTGGVKTGKSAVSLYFAIKTYKRVRRAWRVRRFFCKVFHRVLPEEPLFYSNIPLQGIKYCPITRDHFLRKLRLNFKSVVFLDEASLVADSRLAMSKENKINYELLLFLKLFGHATHGGYLICNSQCITDLHVQLRRCTSSYFYIHHLTSIPFICKVPCIREERYSEDGTTINSYTDDVEMSLKRIIMSARIFKKYDCYCYSFFTDDLPTKNDQKLLTKHDSLKADNIVSFNPDFVKLSESTKNGVDNRGQFSDNDDVPSIKDLGV